jgi:hypothetical protein
VKDKDVAHPTGLFEYLRWLEKPQSSPLLRYPQLPLLDRAKRLVLSRFVMFKNFSIFHPSLWLLSFEHHLPVLCMTSCTNLRAFSTPKMPMIPQPYWTLSPDARKTGMLSFPVGSRTTLGRRSQFSISVSQAKNLKLKFGTYVSFLGNVIVNINGNIDLPKQISVVQQKINSTANPSSTYATPWIYIQGE